MEDYAIIILAAGSSSRMGQAKQLLQIQGKTLLKHTVDEARTLLPTSVYVVTGANAQTIALGLNNDPGIHICHNLSWREGMASSIKAGLQAAEADNPTLKACLISVCDQPFLTAEIYEQLISTHKKHPGSIAASVYNNITGVPVLFDRRYFPLLMELNGQEGAKKILISRTPDVFPVPFPNGHIDLDTPEDYYRYLEKAAGPG